MDLFAQHTQDPWQILAVILFGQRPKDECLVFMERTLEVKPSSLGPVERRRQLTVNVDRLTRQVPRAKHFAINEPRKALNLRTIPLQFLIVIVVRTDTKRTFPIRLPYLGLAGGESG